MAETLFRPTDLNNVQALRNHWFSGNKELDTLDSLPDSAIRNAPTQHGMGYGRSFFVLSTIPFRVPLAIFLRSVSALLECFSFDQAALKFGFRAQDLENPIDQAFRKIYWGSKLLVPSYNSYSKEARYLTNYPDVERSEIQNPLIRDHLTKLFSKVRLNKGEGGLCNGSVNWFNYLCLKAYNEKRSIAMRSETYKEYLSLIASHFKNGQPIQAALLQSLVGIANPLFYLEGMDYVVGQERLKSEKLFLESLKALPDGLYHVRVYQVHSVSLIKCSEGLFVFDPNIGLLEVDGERGLSSLLRGYLEGAREPKVIFSRQELAGYWKYNLNKLWSRVFG